MDDEKSFLSAKIKSVADDPLTLSVETDLQLSNEWSLEAEVWSKPTLNSLGASAAIHLNDSLDITGSASTNYATGEWAAQAGVTLRF